MTYNGESEKLRFPVLPESINVSNGSRNKSVDISGLGEITVIQDRPAMGISFKSFFPAGPSQAAQTETVPPPKILAQTVNTWKNSGKPVHFIITGSDINIYCTVEDFSWTEEGGDVGTIQYSLKLKEYREVSARRIEIKGQSPVIPAKETRTDNRAKAKTYTVVKGDCLWNIARAHLGSGARYAEIYNLNRDKIKNPNLIYAGQVLKMP
jgi:nucleoid-associated protein YgaU